MRVVGVAIAVAASAAISAAAFAAHRATHLTVRLDGSAGALHLGMPRAEAMRALGPKAYALSAHGVRCATYDYGIGGNRGLAAACFDTRRRLIAFSVSGSVFCFQSAVCLDGRSVIPSALRAGFRTTFDAGNGTYFSRRRVDLLGRRYEIVLRRPAFDRAHSAESVGFAPCHSNRAVRYYIATIC